MRFRLVSSIFACSIRLAGSIDPRFPFFHVVHVPRGAGDAADAGGALEAPRDLDRAALWGALLGLE